MILSSDNSKRISQCERRSVSHDGVSLVWMCWLELRTSHPAGGRTTWKARSRNTTLAWTSRVHMQSGGAASPPRASCFSMCSFWTLTERALPSFRCRPKTGKHTSMHAREQAHERKMKHTLFWDELLFSQPCEADKNKAKKKQEIW